MANLEQFELLQQGVDTWNRWKREHPNISPDLRGINFSKADLRGADLSSVKLQGAVLCCTNFSKAHLRGTNFSSANIQEANFSRADLSEADLSYANLSYANLSGTNFNEADLSHTDFSNVKIGWSVFGDVDLRTVQGLETAKHFGPSTIGINTIVRSEGCIPIMFLRGAGVPDSFITYAHSLIEHSLHYYACFISYCGHDEGLARRLYTNLQDQGVRCWFAPVDLKIGDKIRTRIDEAIHQQDKLLLLLSEHALSSAWVEDEVEAAMEKEQRQQREVLFPVRLDDAVMQTSKAWAATLRRTRHIGDFTSWINPQAYQHAFDRLLRDLKTGNSTKEEIDNKPDAS